MQYKEIAAALAAAAALVTVTACSSSETQGPPSSGPAAVSAPSSAADAQAHNEADVAFAQGMIPHHQQAVEMSDMLLAKDAINPEVVALAREIKDAQAPEIETMRGWLNDWNVAAAPPMAGGMPGHDMSGHGNMSDHDVSGHGGMSGAGMMSPADMAALQNAQGVDASRLFLTQMIKHHEGAISMAQNEIDNGEYVPAVDMARSIVSSQQDEIGAMQQLLQPR